MDSETNKQPQDRADEAAWKVFSRLPLHRSDNTCANVIAAALREYAAAETAELREELRKLRVDNAGMGRVLANGICYTTEEATAMVAERNALRTRAEQAEDAYAEACQAEGALVANIQALEAERDRLAVEIVGLESKVRVAEVIIKDLQADKARLAKHLRVMLNSVVASNCGDVTITVTLKAYEDALSVLQEEDKP